MHDDLLAEVPSEPPHQRRANQRGGALTFGGKNDGMECEDDTGCPGERVSGKTCAVQWSATATAVFGLQCETGILHRSVWVRDAETLLPASTRVTILLIQAQGSSRASAKQRAEAAGQALVGVSLDQGTSRASVVFGIRADDLAGVGVTANYPWAIGHTNLVGRKDWCSTQNKCLPDDWNPPNAEYSELIQYSNSMPPNGWWESND